ncbi:MAG: hypothetical protein K1X74_10325 [Pirellulales bacterium]|nr:hypothetical protein [Pirellulales bacterium]
MTQVVSNWQYAVDRGPDWLFVRLLPVADAPCAGDGVADDIWRLAQQHLVSRVVLEMDQVGVLRSELIGQLVLLHKRIAAQGGLLRLCGLSTANQCVLQAARLDTRFHNYADRGAAVMGHRPSKPR